VLDHRDDLEGDTGTDPDRLEVFDCVVDAVMVCVGLIEPVIRGVEVPQGQADWVFEV
jgi:hypothetical protein